MQVYILAAVWNLSTIFMNLPVDHPVFYFLSVFFLTQQAIYLLFVVMDYDLKVTTLNIKMEPAMRSNLDRYLPFSSSSSQTRNYTATCACFTIHYFMNFLETFLFS